MPEICGQGRRGRKNKNKKRKKEKNPAKIHSSEKRYPFGKKEQKKRKKRRKDFSDMRKMYNTEREGQIEFFENYRNRAKSPGRHARPWGG